MTQSPGRDELLNQLTLLKALVSLPTSITSVIADRAKNHGSSQERENFKLETHDIILDRAVKFFPSEHCSTMESLALQLSCTKGSSAKYIRILDLLTIVVVICNGDIITKSKLLFSWYNFSGTGNLTELEHTIMISRFIYCVNRLKIIGSIDVTGDEIRHIATAARYRNINGQIRYLQALNFENFIMWMTEKSTLVSHFLGTLHRLLRVMKGLEERVEILFSISEQRRNSQMSGTCVPAVQSLNCILSLSSITVIQREKKSISIILDHNSISNDCKEIYLLIEKLIPLPLEYSNLAMQFKKLSRIKSLQNENFTDPKMNENNRRHYKLPTTRKVLVNKNQYTLQNSAILRINIADLEPDSKYLITVYTNKIKFTPIEVRTKYNIHNLKNQKHKVRFVSHGRKLFINRCFCFFYQLSVYYNYFHFLFCLLCTPEYCEIFAHFL